MLAQAMLAIITVLPPTALRLVQPGELVVIGPFQIGELYKSADHPNGDSVDQIAKAGGPATEELLKAMKGWKLYILDRKVKEKDRWVWDRPSGKARGEYPKIVLEGRAAVSLKDAAGKQFPFSLQSWDNFTTDLNQHRGDPHKNAEVALLLSIHVEIREMEIPIGGGGSLIGDQFSFTPGQVKYDITGKHVFLPRKSKR